MPFRVLDEEVSLLKSVGEFFDSNGKSIGYEHESRIYFKDDIVADDDLSPVVHKLYEDGDEWTRARIVRVDAKGKAVDDEPEKVEKSQEAIVSKAGTGAHTVTPTDEPIQPKAPAAKKAGSHE